MTKRTKRTLRRGEKIRLPWGLDMVDATVRDIVVRDGVRYVVLRIELKGDPDIPDEILEWPFSEASVLEVVG